MRGLPSTFQQATMIELLTIVKIAFRVRGHHVH